MKVAKNILLVLLLVVCVHQAQANDIQVRNFDELMNSHPISGDTIEFLDDMTSDDTIGYNFYGLDITFEGNNYSINGNDIFGGFVLNQDSLFNQVSLLNCKGQEYNHSNFAGAVYNSGGIIDINNSVFNGNFVDAAGFNFAVGGALYNLNGGVIHINTALFEDNYSDGASSYGGAIANGYQNVGTDAYMTISNSVLKNNYSEGSVIPHGGALYNLGVIDISRTQFDDNYVLGIDRGTYVYGGAIYNEGIASINQVDFRNNNASAQDYSLINGGAIYSSHKIDIFNSIFNNNSVSGGEYSYFYGGSIYNSGEMNIKNTKISSSSVQAGSNSNIFGIGIYNSKSIDIDNSMITNSAVNAGNNSQIFGGALYNDSDMVVKNSVVSSNSIQGVDGSLVKGGAIYNNSKLIIENSTVADNSASSVFESSGGALYNSENGVVTIKNSIIENNKNVSSSVDGSGGAICNDGTITIENSTFRANTNNGTSNDIYNKGTVEFNGSGSNTILSGISGSGKIIKSNSGNLNLGGKNNNFAGDFIFEEGTVNLLAGGSYFNSKNTNFGNNINFNLENKEINNIYFNNLHINGQTNLFVDANLNDKIMDTISAENLGGSGVLFVKKLSLYGAPESSDISIHFANPVLKDYVRYIPETLSTPIYNYRVSYDNTNGNFNFVRGDFNPSIFTSAVATQLGGYLVQLETYKNVFSNLDMVMVAPLGIRKSFSLMNKSANTAGQFAFSPLVIPEQKKGIWFKPYSTFENVPLRHGPRVSNVMYGALVGGESELTKLRRDWYMLYGAYASYNGSHQTYQGNSIYNNGGLIGADAVFYKGGFFSAWTANVGANVAEASTSFGHEEFAMLNTGIAQKSGYNFEVFEGKMIIQPSILTSYSFINTFNYRTASDVSINTKPLHALHIEPGIKFIGNFKNYLQPYLSVSMVWNIIDHARFQANDVYLTDLSIKPYVQYGVGVQKRWGERVTGFLEGMIRNGGRNGIALLFGLRISL